MMHREDQDEGEQAASPETGHERTALRPTAAAATAPETSRGEFLRRGQELASPWPTAAAPSGLGNAAAPAQAVPASVAAVNYQNPPFPPPFLGQPSAFELPVMSIRTAVPFPPAYYPYPASLLPGMPLIVSFPWSSPPAALQEPAGHTAQAASAAAASAAASSWWPSASVCTTGVETPASATSSSLSVQASPQSVAPALFTPSGNARHSFESEVSLGTLGTRPTGRGSPAEADLAVSQPFSSDRACQVQQTSESNMPTSSAVADAVCSDTATAAMDAQLLQAASAPAPQPTSTTRKKNARRFGCDVCGRTFTRGTHLRRHRNSVHFGLRPHSCPHCSQRFAEASDMRSHVRAIHFALRPHVCSECGRSFTRPSHLRMHMIRLHE